MNHDNTIEILLEEYGCDVNQKCTHGNSAFAALLDTINGFDSDVPIESQLDAKQAALYMTYMGADFDSVNDKGETAIEHMKAKRFNAELKKFAKFLAGENPSQATQAEPLENISVKLVNGDKFWNMETFDNQYTVTYGKISNKYSTQQSGDVFASIENCQKEAQKQINSKLKSGYNIVQ